MGRAVDRQTLHDVGEDPPLGGFQFRARRPNWAFSATALGDRETRIVDLRRRFPVIGVPAQFGDAESERFSQLIGRVESGQAVLGGALLGVGEVPLVGPGIVVPVNSLAEVDDVRRAECLPGFELQAALLDGLVLELLLVLLQFPFRHAVGLAALDEKTAFAQLQFDVGLRPAGLHDVSPEGEQIGLSGHNTSSMRNSELIRN